MVSPFSKDRCCSMVGRYWNKATACISQDVPNPKVGIIASTIGASPPNDPASDTFSGTSTIPLCNKNSDINTDKT